MSGSKDWGAEMGPEKHDSGNELSHISEAAKEFFEQEPQRLVQEAAKEVVRATREASFFSESKDPALAYQANDYLLEAQQSLAAQKAALIEQGVSPEQTDEIVSAARSTEKPADELSLEEVQDEINASRERYKKLLEEEIVGGKDENDAVTQRLIRRIIYLENLVKRKRNQE